MPQKLPVSNFKCIEDTCQFNEDFIKSYTKEVAKGYFLEVDAQYFKKIHELHNDLTFVLGRTKTEKVEKLVTNLLIKLFT